MVNGEVILLGQKAYIIKHACSLLVMLVVCCHGLMFLLLLLLLVGIFVISKIQEKMVPSFGDLRDCTACLSINKLNVLLINKLCKFYVLDGVI